MNLSETLTGLLMIEADSLFTGLIQALSGLALVGAFSAVVVDILKLTRLREIVLRKLLWWELGRGGRTPKETICWMERLVAERSTGAVWQFYELPIEEIFKSIDAIKGFAMSRVLHESDPDRELYRCYLWTWLLLRVAPCGGPDPGRSAKRQYLENVFVRAYPPPPDSSVPVHLGRSPPPEPDPVPDCNHPVAKQLRLLRLAYERRSAKQPDAGTIDVTGARETVKIFVEGNIRGAEVRFTYWWRQVQRLAAILISMLVVAYLVDPGSVLLGLVAGAFAPFAHDALKLVRSARSGAL